MLIKISKHKINRVRPINSGFFNMMRELWYFKHFLIYVSHFALQRRYNDTVLGHLWLFLRPLIPAVGFTFIFGELTKLDKSTSGIPYFLFITTGMCLWNLMSSSLIFMTKSIRSSRKILRINLAYPRIIIPLANMAPAIVEFLIFIGLIIIIDIFYFLLEDKLYIVPNIKLLFSLFFVLLTVLLASGIGLWTSVLNARARDVRFTLPFILQVWFYGTPVIYSLASIQSKWKWLIYLNPMAIIIEGFKWCVLNVDQLEIVYYLCLTITCFVVAGVFLSGLWFFDKHELAIVNGSLFSKVSEIDTDDDEEEG
jgi:lipopolysaccharide transport system permease protein